MKTPVRSRLAAGVVLLIAAACLTACGSTGPVVTILGIWVGAEEDAFTQVLDQSGIRYDYEGSRAPGALLQARILKGAPPDIVVLPTIGDLAPYVQEGPIQPLSGILGAEIKNFSAPWVQQVPGQNGRDNYWVPIKANLKSIVWYNPDQPDNPDNRRLPGKPAGWTWAQLSGRTWCLGVGDTPNSGWPASDWIEDLLLHQSGSGTSSYQQWIASQLGPAGTLAWSSQQVKDAWLAWGGLLAGQPYHGSAALLTDQDDAARGMYGEGPRCELEHQASFALKPPDGPGSRPQDFIQLPAVTPQSPPRVWEVSADVASLFTDDSPKAKDMIRYLASDRAQAIWPANSTTPAFSVDRSPSFPQGVYGTDVRDVRNRIATVLRGTDTLCLDAGDLMPATMRDAFYRGLLEYMSAVAAKKPTKEQLEPILKPILDGLDQVRTQSYIGPGTDNRWELQACGSAQ
jgi:alpha-glucoside transport system substrate-binding protein